MFTKTASLILYKSADGQSLWMEGVASDNSVDRDGDQMSLAVLHSWAKQINEEGVNAFVNHEHGLFDTIGVWREAEVVNGSLVVRARLEDPNINQNVKQLLAKIDAGTKIGLSIGGDLTRSHTERRNGGPVRVIDEAPLYEISTVGIPANGNSEVLGVMYKNLQKGPNLHDGYNQYQDPAYSGAYVSGRATDSVLGNNKILPSEFSSPLVNQRDWVQQSKPDGRFLTGGQPDRGKLLSTRSPMQPEAKIAAEPGKSGSSEVFRTDLGQRIDLNEDEKKALSDIRTWALQKRTVPQAFRDQFMQDEHQRDVMSENERTLSMLEQYRSHQERLHSLGQPHEQSMCRHCVGEQPSALNQPRPGQTYTYTMPQSSVRKGDIYIVNGDQSTETTDSLGEGPVETARRIYQEQDDSEHPEMNPVPIKPTRSPTGSPLSQDTLKTEEGDPASQDSIEGGNVRGEEARLSGNPNVRTDEDEEGYEPGVDTGTDARLKIVSPSEEIVAPGTDLRLAPKRRHYAH